MAKTATDFSKALRQFTRTSEQRMKDCATFAFQEVTKSVVRGSELTGAPGQPVALVRGGTLRSSWVTSSPEPHVRELTTNVEYAVWIEDGGNDLGFYNPARGDPRSEVGGYHSVKLTEAAWPEIVEMARKKAQGPRA